MDNGDRQELHKRLITACQQGDGEAAHQVLEDPDFSCSVYIDAGEGLTPIHLAAGGGHENVVRLLLMRGAMVDGKNSYGWTPLMQAASCGHAHIVALLLQNKADPNTKNKLGASALTLAALGGHLSVVGVLLDYPGVDLNDRQIDGQAITPTMAAAMHGYRSVVKLLVDRGSDHFHVERSTGWTNLMMASLGGGRGVVELLLGYGVDPDAADVNQRTALEVATLLGSSDVKELLESKTTNVTRVAGLERTRIIGATEVGDEDLVKQLLDDDPSRCNVTSKEGATPLMVAAMLGHRAVAEVLVRNGADVNQQEKKSGWTALMQATFHRKLDMVEYLVRVGADATIQATDGCRALDLALVIINDETDKSGDQMICLLASQTMPAAEYVANGGPPGSTGGCGGSGQLCPLDDEDPSKGGLKAWWSRMSNRFRNLKLTRTLRAGFSSSKLSPMEDDVVPYDQTVRSAGVGPSKTGLNDDGRHCRKSKETRSVEFNLGNATRKDSGFGETQSLKSMTMPPPSFGQSDHKFPSVIPPFLPPPTFEFQGSDRRHTQPSIKTMRTTSLSRQRPNQSRANNKPNRLLFTRRSATGASPSSSLRRDGMSISPDSTGRPWAPGHGKITPGRLSLLSSPSRSDRAAAGSEANEAFAGEEAGSRDRAERASDELARYQRVSSGTTRTASSTSSTLSGSLKPPVKLEASRRKSSRATGSTTSTLTPPASPVFYTLPNDASIEASSPETMPPPSSSSGVGDEDEFTLLLKKLSLERYAPIFEDQEVDMDAFLALNESDLLEMGIDGSGHRRQLMKVISKLNSGQP